MTRSVALRASALFLLLSLVFAAIGAGSQTLAAEALFVIAASVGAVTILFALVASPGRQLQPIPVRARRRR